VPGADASGDTGTATYTCNGNIWSGGGTCTANACPTGYAWDFVGPTNNGTPFPVTTCTSANYNTNSPNNNDWFCGCSRKCNNSGIIPCSGGSVNAGHLCQDNQGLNNGFPWMYDPSNSMECVCVANGISCV